MFGSKFIEQSIFNASAKGTAIIPFITAGYPEKNEFSNLVLSLSEAADVIEIGAVSYTHLTLPTICSV